MNIEGTYTMQAAPEEVWSQLTSIEVLQTLLPEMKQLLPVEAGEHQFRFSIKQGPLQGTYAGRVKITEQRAPSYLCFVIESQDNQDSLSGIGKISLQFQEPQQTIISYRGTLHINKQSSHIPPSVLKGATKLFIQESLTQLSEQLRASHNGHHPENSFTPQKRGELHILPPSLARSISQSEVVWQQVAHHLHLGANDPVQEAIWGRRVKKAGSAAGLLLLVWVGTRIPRRKRVRKQRSQESPQEPV